MCIALHIHNLIQIQHLLKLNLIEQTARQTQDNSNTTLVKVKLMLR